MLIKRSAARDAGVGAMDDRRPVRVAGKADARAAVLPDTRLAGKLAVYLRRSTLVVSCRHHGAGGHGNERRGRSGG